jgi:hypothetical protein
MRKMTLIVLTGLVLLFLGSLFAGYKVFSPEERSLAPSHQVGQAEQTSPEVAAATQKKAQLRKVRLALSSFDLIAGFTDKELEAIPTISLTFPFFYLLACFWLILGLRKPSKD